MPNGKTEPLLVETDNGFYVAKIQENVDGIKVLINEFVCYKLAKKLGVPIPEAALLRIDQEVIDADPALKKTGIKPGLHFGSKFLHKSNASIQPPIVGLVTNKEDIPSIVLFDQLIYNDDRTMNPGNLIVDLKAKEILAIDHSHPFRLGALWDENELKKIHQDPFCLIRDFYGPNYKVLLKYVNGNSPFHKIETALQFIEKEDVSNCVNTLPVDWEITKEDKDALKEFLWHRIKNVEEFMKLLYENCPDWKGGNLL